MLHLTGAAMVLLLLHHCQVQAQITALDSPLFRSKLRMFESLAAKFISNTGDKVNIYKTNYRAGKVQPYIAENVPFFCSTAGMRSSMVPTSVDKLRPGDIDVVGAIGDSLTAANGALATNVLEVFVENRGMAWSIGGQANWRQFLTLPNILKEFNHNLYGYPVMDGRGSDKSALFNAAVPGGMSQDLTLMAKNLVKRMLSDPNVDLKNHWKLITVMIGGNDFCINICYTDPPEKALMYHEANVVAVLRIFRDYLPRTFVNLVSAPNVDILNKFRATPKQCYTFHVVECPCFKAPRYAGQRQRYIGIVEKWNQLQQDISNREEFNGKPDFAVVYQPFFENLSIPSKPNGDTDFTYMSMDCFHLSQKGNARAANALWNNMLEPVGRKAVNWEHEFDNVKCPTPDRPYLRTNRNS